MTSFRYPSCSRLEAQSEAGHKASLRVLGTQTLLRIFSRNPFLISIERLFLNSTREDTGRLVGTKGRLAKRPGLSLPVPIKSLKKPPWRVCKDALMLQRTAFCPPSSFLASSVFVWLNVPYQPAHRAFYHPRVYYPAHGIRMEAKMTSKAKRAVGD